MTIWTDAAQLCAQSYMPNFGAWPYVAQAETEGVWWAVVNYDRLTWVVFRGSETFSKTNSVHDVVEDWARDFLAVPEHPFISHPQLGWVHAGFMMGMEAAWSEIKKHIQGNVIYFTGHSLGAARATIATGMCRLDFPSTSLYRIVFGEPNESIGAGGVSKLNLLCQDHWVSNYSFRTTEPSGECDPVTLVPPEPYYCPTRRINVPSTVMLMSELDVAKMHAIDQYEHAVEGYSG